MTYPTEGELTDPVGQPTPHTQRQTALEKTPHLEQTHIKVREALEMVRREQKQAETKLGRTNLIDAEACLCRARGLIEEAAMFEVFPEVYGTKGRVIREKDQCQECSHPYAWHRYGQRCMIGDDEDCQCDEFVPYPEDDDAQ